MGKMHLRKQTTKLKKENRISELCQILKQNTNETTWRYVVYVFYISLPYVLHGTPNVTNLLILFSKTLLTSIIFVKLYYNSLREDILASNILSRLWLNYIEMLYADTYPIFKSTKWWIQRLTDNFRDCNVLKTYW